MRALTELKKESFSRVSDNIACLCGISSPKRLLIHHLSYTSESITYNKFENSDEGRLKYYANLLDEIKTDPTNFLILCFKCHKEVEKLLKMTFGEVLFLVKTNTVDENIIEAYNLTCLKRGLKSLNNPDDDYVEPHFLHAFSCYWHPLVELGRYEESMKEKLTNDILDITLKLESKKISLQNYASIRILSQDLGHYIRPYQPHVIAAKLLEPVRLLKKGDSISYIRILNKPYFKPIELVRLEEIDIQYYMVFFKSRFLNIFKGIYDSKDFEIMQGKIESDKFFWS